MITVKLYGLLRLDSGIRELQVEADSIRTLLRLLNEKGIDNSVLFGCNILINGENATRRSTLKNGDTVQLFPPVAGG